MRLHRSHNLGDGAGQLGPRAPARPTKEFFNNNKAESVLLAWSSRKKRRPAD
jgi:hypothetical protein